jgi:methenyltetrahydromethanopterin cyclohydrolase
MGAVSIKSILIVASSARLLAQLIRKEGVSPLAIDSFTDVDTQKSTLEAIKVGDLSIVHVKEAISILSQRHCITHVIYGSGLERHQDTLKYLEQNFIVVGNSVDVFSAVQNKVCFFKKLKQHHISYPETSFHPPGNEKNWLVKPLFGEGGIGIKKYGGESIDCYWQKYCAGTPRSVLFIAKRAEYKIIGFHKQFTAQINDHQFVFAGVINQPEINSIIIQALKKILDNLVVEFALKGINSLDFIEKNSQCYVLEINPRPSASLNLYNSSLLSEHINSSTKGGGALAPPDSRKEKALSFYRAYKILFAEKDITISNQIVWPLWVLDIPCEGSIINTGDPICSIIAGGKNEQQVEGLLLSRQQQLTKLLT